VSHRGSVGCGLSVADQALELLAPVSVMQINMMLMWMEDTEIYQTILHDQKAFIDAASYLCTRLKYSHKHTMSTRLEFTWRQQASFRAASTYKEIREAAHGPMAETCCHTLTLFGQIATFSGPVSTLFGFQQLCNGCGCALCAAQHKMK
jgi:hypothetical protein